MFLIKIIIMFMPAKTIQPTVKEKKGSQQITSDCGLVERIQRKHS